MSKSDTLMYVILGTFGVLGGAAGLAAAIWLLKSSVLLAQRHPVGTVALSIGFGAVLACVPRLVVWMVLDSLLTERKR
jgi:hypothetical protein